MNTKDLKVNKSALRVLVYGHSGTGKTTFASTFPKPYFFDFDSGMLSVRGKDIEYDSFVEKDPDRPQAFTRFKRQVSAFIEDPKDWKTIVIDSITCMQRTLMNQVLYTNHHTTPTLPDWGIIVGELEGLFYRLLRMPIHLVVTAHEEILKDKVTGEIKIQPHVYGNKLAPKLPDWFDEYYRSVVMRKGTEHLYRIITKAEGKFSCKSRISTQHIKIFDTEEVPDFGILMRKLEREIATNTKTLSRGGK